jgi:aminopeptidase N
MFGTNTYLKGAWLLHMLRQELGDQLFFQVIREYYRQYAYSNATTAGFQSVAAQVSGKDLESFFQQWAYAPINPHLALTWTSRATTGGSEVTMQVCQLQGQVIFMTPMTVSLESTDGTVSSGIIQIDEGQERLALSVPFDPIQIEADPDQGLLAATEVKQVDTLSPCGE